MAPSLPWESESREESEIRRDTLWDTIRHLEARPLSRSLDADPDFRALRAHGDPAEIALFFLEAHRALFRLKRPRRELAVLSATTDSLGSAHVKLGQVYEGLEVWGAEIAVHLDAEREVYLVSGRYVRTPEGLELRAELGASEALSRAAEALGAPLRPDEASEPRLVIFPGESGELALAFLVRARVSDAQVWQILIDANDGHEIDRIPAVFTPRSQPSIGASQPARREEVEP